MLGVGPVGSLGRGCSKCMPDEADDSIAGCHFITQKFRQTPLISAKMLLRDGVDAVVQKRLLHRPAMVAQIVTRCTDENSDGRSKHRSGRRSSRREVKHAKVSAANGSLMSLPYGFPLRRRGRRDPSRILERGGRHAAKERFVARVCQSAEWEVGGEMWVAGDWTTNFPITRANPVRPSLIGDLTGCRWKSHDG